MTATQSATTAQGSFRHRLHARGPAGPPMGFVIAVGVLLDTFLVRTYLVTSAAVALQRRMWWPGALSRTPAPPAAPQEPRERQVLGLVARGLNNTEIAETLGLSPLTAKTHVSRIMGRLGARDRAQLVIIAYESGLVVAAGGGAGGN